MEVEPKLCPHCNTSHEETYIPICEAIAKARQPKPAKKAKKRPRSNFAKVRLHGTSPENLGQWIHILTLNYIEAFDLYQEECFHPIIRMTPKGQEKPRPEANNAEHFDERFLNTGFRVLYQKGPMVYALVKRFPNYQLVAIHKTTFREKYREQYRRLPQSAAKYAEL